MISKRAFARRIASIHIASNIDYTKVDAIGFSEDNLADEMASILYNLVTQTPLWRKSEKILVDQYLSRGADSLLPKGRARRINRKTNLINRLMTQINNSDIVRVLDRQFDADEMAELAKNSEFSTLVAPYIDQAQMLEEALSGGNSAYSRASSFLKENVLPSVARRYFPQYLVSRLGEIAKTKEGFRSSVRERNFSVSLRDRVDYYFSLSPKASELASDVRALSKQAFIDEGFRQEIFNAVFSTALDAKSMKPKIAKIKKDLMRIPERYVGIYLKSLPQDYFDADFNASDEETKEVLRNEARSYLREAKDGLVSLSESVLTTLFDSAYERILDKWDDLRDASEAFDSSNVESLYNEYVSSGVRGSFLDFLLEEYQEVLGRNISSLETKLVSRRFRKMLRELQLEDWMQGIDVEDLF